MPLRRTWWLVQARTWTQPLQAATRSNDCASDARIDIVSKSLSHAAILQQWMLSQIHPCFSLMKRNYHKLTPCFSLMKTILSQINPCLNLMKTMLSQLNICLPIPGRGSAMRAETSTRISDACRDQQPWLSAPPPFHAAMCTDRLWAFMISTVLTMLLLLS